MIDFACKDIGIEELIRCSFQLSVTEYRILKRLIETEEKSVKQLATELDVDRSTVHKSLKHLKEKNLVSRKQYNIPSGGYRYFYSSESKEEIRNRLEDLIENWSSSAKEAVESW